jgi:hypothetical protein
MATITEVTNLRNNLARFQTRLETLEARLATRTPIHVQLSNHKSEKSKDELVEVKQTTSPHKTPSSRSKREPQTLRSRSFKVMQHLINVVDILHVEDTTSNLKKIHINRNSSCDSVSCRSSA